MKPEVLAMGCTVGRRPVEQPSPAAVSAPQPELDFDRPPIPESFPVTPEKRKIVGVNARSPAPPASCSDVRPVSSSHALLKKMPPLSATITRTGTGRRSSAAARSSEMPATSPILSGLLAKGCFRHPGRLADDLGACDPLQPLFAIPRNKPRYDRVRRKFGIRQARDGASMPERRAIAAQSGHRRSRQGLSVETDLLRALPAAIYVTDAEGRLTFYNEAAVQLWGCRPEIGSSRWCGSWRLYRADGTPMPHDECPMAISIKEGRSCAGAEVIAERPDGTRVPFVAYPNVLKDASGNVTGTINLLIDTVNRKQAELAAAWLAAIVSSSDDAIVSKTLGGTITSWNAGATRIFGYAADEMIGCSIKKIIPPELQSEEDLILAKLRRGERIDHFETERLASDGSRVPISITVSPIRDGTGTIIGASKVARDISERKRHDEMQRLLVEELNHRVKNTLATIQAIATQSMQRTSDPANFVTSFNGRVQALARAHDLLVQSRMQGATLLEIIRDQVVLGSDEGARVSCSGPDITLDARLAVQLALVLHELATNARKHGALGKASGRLSITWEVSFGAERELHLTWKESALQVMEAPRSRGFGMTLIERSLTANGGEAAVRYEADGLRCEIRLPVPESSGGAVAIGAPGRRPVPAPVGEENRLRGKRVLIIEDEPLVAMDMEAELASLGVDVVGPVSTVAEAEAMIESSALDAALLDANLHGTPVQRLAEALEARSVPFAFATGYGRAALPEAFRGAPVLAKPFERRQLVETLVRLLAARHDSSTVVQLRPRGRQAARPDGAEPN